MELSKVLSKVHSLITLAEHPNTGEDEARAAREMADALMLKYAIEEATLDATRPVTEQMKPDTLDFAVGAGADIDGWLATLASYVAAHCRCKVRNYVAHRDGVWQSRAYGYQSDLRYFEMLWTTLRLHMTGVLRPAVDPALSLEDNCYALHEVGFNWLEIAGMYGWRKASNSMLRAYHESYPEADVWDVKVPFYKLDTDEIKPATQVGSHFKRAYYRAVEARGEQPTKIQGSASKTFRNSASQGYVSRIVRRLHEVEDRRGAGTSLALRADALEDFYRESNASWYTRCPHCNKLSDNMYDCDRCGAHIADAPEAKEDRRRGRAYKPQPFSDTAYRRGVAHANTADLGGPKAGSAQRPEIG
jgi:hypothetical protein